MPKNIYLPKENLAQIEIVQKLKDEYKVPSFEEFMKTYESDSNLNYDDLSSNDIGTQKGYGPVEGGDCKGGSSNYSSSSSNDVDYDWKKPKRVDFGPLNEFVPWVAKTSLVATASWLFGPEVAFKVGGLTWGTTKIIEGVIDNEEMKEVLRLIGDIGWDTAQGAFIGKLIGVSSDSLASKTTQEIGRRTAAEISANGGKIPADVRDLIRLGKLIYLGQKTYDLYDEYGKPTCELARHVYHKDKGRSYDSDCDVCNP